MNQDFPPQTIQNARTGHDLERLALKGLLLFCMAVIVYIPAMLGGYIYDDDSLLTQNPIITSGSGFSDAKSWKGLETIWFPIGENPAFDNASPSTGSAVPSRWEVDPAVFDYTPLSTTTLWVEWRLWGYDGSSGYHITNILLHAAGALLLWAVLARIGMPGAWVAALVWAVHPVGVESVAWIAERRNTLSMPMLLLTLLAWFRFQHARRWRDYGLALLLFAGALLAKSTVVMLPFFMLLWIWWSRNRVTLRDMAETAPFFLLSLLDGLATAWFQYHRAMFNERLPIGGLFHRMVSAIFALAFYLYKAVLPFNLMFNYPEWHNTVWPGFQVLPAFAFAAAFYWMWLNRRTWGRHAFLGLGFFVIMIAPALGVMKMAYMRITLVADHFQYMPMAGVIALAVAGAAWLRARKGAPVSYVIDAAAAGVVLLFCVLTWQRADVFHDPESLWLDTLRENPDAWQAHEHLGGILLQRGDLAGALEHFRRGVELRPWLGETHGNYGNTLRRLGRPEDQQKALNENRIAVELYGSDVPPNIRVSYADALATSNHPREAIVQYRELLKQNSENPVLLYNIGRLNEQLGNTGDAIDLFRQALRFSPDFQLAKDGLAEALHRQELERAK